MDTSKNLFNSGSRVDSSPEILSPGGKSRYGRTRRPKISQDFYNIDDVIFEDNPPNVKTSTSHQSPKPKSPLKSPTIGQEILLEIKDEFTQIDDLGMKVANNFKTNLQRGLDDTIKERKFFKSTSENKMEPSHVVDVTKVFKLISNKPQVISEVYERKNSPKTVLKTYTNRRKQHLHDSESFIVESFGLPDEPIIPVNSPVTPARNTKIDMDLNNKADVNLANPWRFNEFQDICVSDPLKTVMEEINEANFSKNTIINLFNDRFLSESKESEVYDLTSSCEEKSTFRDLTRIKENTAINLKCDDDVEIVQEKKTIVDVTPNNKIRKLNGNNKIIDDVIDLTGDICEINCNTKTVKRQQKFGELHKNKLVNNDRNLGIRKKENKVKNNILYNELEKFEKLPIKHKRILRSNFDNSQEIKEENLSDQEDAAPRLLRSSVLTNLHVRVKQKTQKKVINPVKLSKVMCKSQVKVILNPLSMKKLNDDENIPNLFKVKSENETKEESDENLNSISQVIAKTEKKVLKNRTKTSVELNPPVKIEDLDIKNIKTEIVEYQVGDLTWAKIGSHPYWPCMITEEPFSGQHKKFFTKRSQPHYHVRFFGDKGRRSWVSAHHIMLYCGRDDLDKLAKILKAEDKVRASFIKESYTVKPTKLAKWTIGVEEAESLKYKTVDERLNYFFEIFAGKREKKKRNIEFQIKEEILDETLELADKGRKREAENQNEPKNKKKAKNQDENQIKKKELKNDNKNRQKMESEQIQDSPRKTRNSQNNKDEEPRKKSKANSPIKIDLTKDSPTMEVRKRLRNSTNQSKDESDVQETRKKSRNSQDLKIKISPQKKEESDNNDGRKKLRNSQTKEETVDDSRKKKNKDESIEENQDVRKKVKRNSTEDAAQEIEENEENLIPKLRNKRHLLQSEYSNSDTDSKFSDNSSVPTSLESQAALYRRNNIFRGIPKEKVCQICEKPGDVFKCKGPCSGVYHYNCAMSLSNIEQVESKQEKTEEINDNKSNVEIVSIPSKKEKPLPNLSMSPTYKGMSLAEKIDFRMKEIMKKFDYQSVYSESTDSSSEEFILDESFEKNNSKSNNQSKLSLTVTNKPSKKEVPIIKHVTADNINYICVTDEKPKEKEVSEVIKTTLKQLKCHWCSSGEIFRCLVCNKEESKIGSKFRQKCSLHQCGKYYHPECLKMWPQTQWSLIQSTKDKKTASTYDTFVCPRHICHTCISDDPRAANSRCTSDKVVKCLRCPATYHSSNYCVPAGSHILSSSQIVCPRHFSNQKSSKKRNYQQTINTNWCFICSKGGNLICCETCPTSVHVECLPGDLNEDDTFYCEDCQSGRLPLYDEIVWVKLGTFRWWPALILFPNEVPDNVRNIAHNKGEFVVKFFGTYDHYWVGRGRTFLFQEGDTGHSNPIRKRVDNAFAKAIEEAAAAHQLKKQFKVNKVAEKNSALKPPPYIRIKVNKPVGNVRQFDGNTSNTTSCDCDPNQPHPCGPDSDCLNRLLLTECNPEVCPAGDRCNNQCFEKREYPPLVPHRTQVRGWGLKTLAPIRKGQFVIEYVGEMIDEQEYQRRIQKMHEQKEENYYFLTIDKDRTLDAGPKGNVARFMNHSCQPNCETQKWTVNGDTRVGLFAKCDIPADTELTFNYNLECIGKEKKICKCGAPNCSGFIGVKVKSEGSQKKSNKPKKKKSPPPPVFDVVSDNPCFVCGKMGEVGACNNKICTKYYHMECLGLSSWPEGGKWVCPWHNCNVCSKRTIRCCVKCINSFCPPHSEGNVRYDKLLGFVCTEHDPTKESNEIEVTKLPKSDVNVTTEESAVTSTTSEEAIPVSKPNDDDDFIDSLSLKIRLNGGLASTPLKKTKEDNSQDENTVSSASVSDSPQKKSKKKKKTKKNNGKKVTVSKAQVKNTANLFNSPQNEVKLSNFTPVKYLRTSRNSSSNRTDPDKDLPIRKRTRLRCENTL